MSRIAIVYGTTDGQTAKIARFIADILRTEHQTVDLLDARSASVS